METLFFSAFALSLSFAAQPGVITFESIRRGIERGWQAALYIQFGSMVGDATWALVALIGASVLFQVEAVALGLSLFGCGLLLWMAWSAWRAAQKEVVEQAANQNTSTDFMTGASLSLSNPQNLSFWLGMSGTVISLGFLNPQPAHLAVFFTGFMLAQLLWSFFFALLVAFGRQIINQRFFRWINLICAAVLAYLGITLLISTVQRMI